MFTGKWLIRKLIGAGIDANKTRRYNALIDKSIEAEKKYWEEIEKKKEEQLDEISRQAAFGRELNIIRDRMAIDRELNKIGPLMSKIKFYTQYGEHLPESEQEKIEQIPEWVEEIVEIEANLGPEHAEEIEEIRKIYFED